MTATVEFLSRLRSLGLTLWADGDRLRYSAPEGALTATLRDELIARKVDVLAILREARLIARSATPRMVRNERDADSEPVPLSYAQERRWFWFQLAPESSGYNISIAARILGPLDVGVFERCLNEIVRRHEALRTALTVVNGHPRQVITPSVTISVPVLDLRLLPENAREAEVLRRGAREVQTPIAVGEAPLVRGTLMRVGGDEHVLLLVFDHSVFDAWSLQILERELTTLYPHFRRGGSGSPLPEPGIQYADFVCWQRALVDSGAIEPHLSYWKQRLAGAPPVLELPTDRPRPPRQTAPGAARSFVVPSAVSAALKTLARREKITLFMIVLAAFKTLLHRYTGHDDLVVGTPTANRTTPEAERVIGCFVNVLVLRTDLSGDPTFRELLGRVRETVLEAHDHQDLPFELLVRALSPERTLSHPPVFQVMVNLLNVPAASVAKLSFGEADLEVTPVTGLTEGTIFDLELTARDVGAEIVGTLAYRTDLFDDATIERLLGNFNVLLESVAGNPDARLSELGLLSADDRHRAATESHGSAMAFPLDSTFSELFEAQVARTPDAVAVTTQAAALTYRELNARANRLARVLVERGVGPEVLVAVLAERGLEFLTAVLAIFKAGGAYLPLDPRHPAQRLQQTILQSNAGLLLVGAELMPAAARVAGRGGSTPPLNVMAIEPLEVVDRADDNLSRCSIPRHLAYVIYTSGSTGVPKGAMIEQVGMVNHLYAKILDLRLTAADTVAQTASHSFDISVWQYLAALLVGGRVHILSDDIAHHPGRLLDAVEEGAIAVLEVVPSFLRKMLEELARRGAAAPSLAALRWLVATGEALPTALCRGWFEQYEASVPIVNAYGPTECSDDVTHGVFAQPPAEEAVRAPIGRPIANMQTYVLDGRLQPVPVGVVGELFVGGVGVGRGYRHDAARTAEVFIPDPFSPIAGARLYRTGDLARRLPDGRLDVVGRTDHQVKIRGFRIESGEVEAALREHPGVADAVVLAREAQHGQAQLVGYVVPASGAAPTAGELRAFLKEKLPDYMLPSAFVSLDKLPLTSTGKLDRAALPALDPVAADGATAYVAPRNAAEETLAGLWADVLACERIGVHDNFFERGGHSLIALDLVDRMANAFHVELSVRDLFDAPTVAEMGQTIERVLRDGPSAFAPIDVTDLNAEAALDATIVPRGAAPTAPDAARHVFLTGATGFLGSFLLQDLLRQTDASIYCLVRADDEPGARRRLERALASYSIPHEEFATRIIAVPGDLARPFFGWQARRFETFASTIDVIYHSGAWVNLLYPYRALKAVNVSGTQEVLRLAATGKVKPVHHVSTVTVLSSVGYEVEVIYEDQDLDQLKNLYGGYAQTKWVAEKMVMAAGARGLPVCIYRPHRITGHSRSGASNRDDLASRVMQVCLQLGIVPDIDGILEMTPVDYVSQAIVHLSRRQESYGKVFNLANPHTVMLSEAIDWVRALGYPLEQVPHAEWQARAFDYARRSPHSALYPISHLLSDRLQEQLVALREEMPAARLPRFDCRNTIGGLVGTSINCAPIEPALLERTFAYFVGTRFFEPPPRSGSGAPAQALSSDQV